uniref:Uncharacterized protein n=1 Tax=Glossina austeni TaxID=7395 RepID=A0A1A9UMR9_GLOAU
MMSPTITNSVKLSLKKLPIYLPMTDVVAIESTKKKKHVSPLGNDSAFPKLKRTLNGEKNSNKLALAYLPICVPERPAGRRAGSLNSYWYLLTLIITFLMQMTFNFALQTTIYMKHEQLNEILASFSQKQTSN